MFVQPGAKISPTIDIFTRPGAVQIVHATSEQLEADYEAIRKLEMHGLFEIV